MKRTLVFIGMYAGVLAVLVLILFFISKPKLIDHEPLTFNECVAAGNPIQESYPARCRSKEGKTFIEDIGNEMEKMNLIKISSPRPNASVKSPLVVTGTARGTWFFEASFPVHIEDAFGNVIARGTASAKSDWMTTDFVPFEATLTFTSNPQGYGKLILEKDNPSALPENDDSLIVPIQFKQ